MVKRAVVGGAGRTVRRRALRAYALVYSVLALAEDVLPADEAMKRAVRVLLTPEQRDVEDRTPPLDDFPFGEPERSRASCGYSALRDVLWVRPHQFFRDDESRMYGSSMAAVVRLLERDRYLWPRLRRFFGSPRWKDWQTGDVRVYAKSSSDLSARDQAAYRAIAHAHGQARVPYRGALLVGHDADKLPGVYVLGVRHQEWLVQASSEERLWWLLQPPDFVAPLLGDVGRVDLSFCLRQSPSVRAFVGRERAFRSMGRALLSWHENPVPDPWYWRRRQPDRALLPCVEEFRFGPEVHLACFLPYTEDPARVVGDLRTALVAAQQDGVLPHRTTVVVVCSLSLRAAECAIAEVAAGDPGLCGNVRFLVVDGPMIEALGRRYPWVWELAFAAINQEPAPLCSPPSLYEETQVRTLAARAHKAAALAALRSVLALPRLEAPSADIYAMVHDLVHLLGPDACWDIPREAARALKGEWRRARRARGPHDAEHSELSPGSLTTSALLTAAQSDGWAMVPQQGSVQWWGFVRLLRLWRSAGADSVASAFANRVRAMLRDGAFSTDVVDTAWRESRPARPASSADRDVTPD